MKTLCGNTKSFLFEMLALKDDYSYTYSRDQSVM